MHPDHQALGKKRRLRSWLYRIAEVFDDLDLIAVTELRRNVSELANRVALSLPTASRGTELSFPTVAGAKDRLVA